MILQTPQAEELSLLSVKLASQFLFHSGFRTKKSLRGPAIDWYEKFDLPVNYWYAFNVLSRSVCVRAVKSICVGDDDTGLTLLYIIFRAFITQTVLNITAVRIPSIN